MTCEVSDNHSPQKHTMSAHQRPASDRPSQWPIAGGPLMTRRCVLAGQWIAAGLAHLKNLYAHVRRLIVWSIYIISDKTDAFFQLKSYSLGFLGLKCELWILKHIFRYQGTKLQSFVFTMLSMDPSRNNFS